MESGDYVLAGKTLEWDEGSPCLNIVLGDASAKGLLIKEDAAQTAYSLEVQSSAGTTIFGIKAGTITGSLQTQGATVTTGINLDLASSALTTGKVIDISDLAAITTGKAIHIDATGVTQTDGILVHIDSASTALTSTGRLLLVDHTGNATVSGVVAEVKTAAADETVGLLITAASITTGSALKITVTAITTAGCGIDLSGVPTARQAINFADGAASAIDPSATAESGWINIGIAGVVKYIPYYAAS